MGLQSIIKKARRWFFNTPERALDEAYRIALMIKAIENEHFQGKKVSRKFTEYGESVVSYFQKEVDGYIKNIKARLIEFESSRSIVKFAQNVEGNRNYKLDEPDIIIDKLNFIENIISKYEKDTSGNKSVALMSLSSQKKETNTRIIATNNEEQLLFKKDENEDDPLETVSDKTGVLPRSILRTFSRIKQEIDPESVEAEEEVVKKYRKSRDKTAISIRFLLILVIIPLLVHQFVKITILETHVIEKFFLKNNQTEFFLNRDIEEEALMKLKRYKEKLELREYINITPQRFTFDNKEENKDTETIEEKLKTKAESIVEEYKDKSLNALANVFSDIFSFITFIVILLVSKRDIIVLKAFIDEIIYGLSDSAKAFLIILFTDMFVGYHSPHGWEIILEGLAHHLGIPENREFNFLFIATFPVILDTVLKYWIFRYLNRISPSAVATYRNMNE